ELAEVAEGAMRLRVRNAQSWTALRYRHAVDEEVKIVVQVRNTPPDGPNLAIAISGDLQTGYRLRIDGYHQIDLETIQHGYWEMLQRCAFTLDARADAYTFVLWRADNVFYAEVNGERIMTYEEPFAAQGATHRTIGLGRYGVLGDALIDSVHLWSRRSPRYVDILEPGRVLLRHGHREDALRWFQRIAEEHQEASLQHEAAYLVALATPDTEEAVKDAALQRVTSDSENPFRTRALREHALLRLRRGDFAGAVESAVQLQALTPDAGLVQHLANSLVSVVKTVGREAQAPVLTCLAALPLTLLQLSDAPLVSLEDLRGMRLTHLACWPGYIDDLSPVADMPLTNLTCDNNQLTALTPLAGMSLTACSVARNAITDLSPLAGMPLTTLTCNDNRIEHLTPLRGMPLQALNCSGNLVRDLSPLAGAPLTVLSCAENQIQEVRALAASPLERLDCTLNPISDFTPLPATLQVLYCTATRITDLRGIAHLALREFACGMNRLTDLRPLAAMPLSCLYCEGNPITDLTPLAHLPLAILGIGTIPLTPANGEALAALPLRELGADCLDEAMLALIAAHPTLHIVNAHVRDHVLRVAPTAYAALTAWRNNPSIPLDHRYALRPVAAAMGERAYLSLPIRLPRQEAIAFCRWQGGTLVSPATEVQNTALLQYLTPIVQSASPVCHYLGITIDAEARTLRWHSGAPYAWHRWQSPEEHLFRAHRGHPTFISNITHRYHIWWETEWTPLYPMYTIIEWT
ncbi:MAG TPA: hypothetical protein PLZ36_13640, partial [Armatimonadota bacterium]|nr:hypothetical protein [Armatimonadota bacterium]